MADIGELLQLCVKHNASDMHLTVGKPPTLRIDGGLMSLNYEPLTHEHTEALMKSITSNENQRKIQEVGGVDFGFAFEKIARFRVSVYKQKGHYGLTLRLIPTRLLTFEEIGLPVVIRDLLFRPRGLLLVTGPTGSGKTTTLATMTDFINTERDCHIITIEDPIEYYHSHKKGIITQRELGVDVPSFREALIKGLRQNPDVILVGEMRDLATIEAAILAAETGHLVMATLHTTSAASTVDRIIDVFPPNQQEQIRTQLSTSILAVISQQLLVKASGRGRIGSFEIMINTPSIQNLIREKKTYRITSDLQTGGKYGMKTFDTSLFELFSRGLIRGEDAIAKAFDPEQMKAKVEGKI
ncbi:MAG: type IV pilus twitching motility protein PilT [Candidatus Omnitrophica bacterium]|nr:type IV pilus twitching motility protein PilT [Candidatus Omnitrophota bacterium]MBU4479362.1 type IV pilus twitching motility protein PilT [Candidatus Omnitrophota bacterium]